MNCQEWSAAERLESTTLQNICAASWHQFSPCQNLPFFSIFRDQFVSDKDRNKGSVSFVGWLARGLLATGLLSLLCGFAIGKDEPAPQESLARIVVVIAKIGLAEIVIGLLLLAISKRNAPGHRSGPNQPVLVKARHGMSIREWFAITAIVAGVLTFLISLTRLMIEPNFGYSFTIGPFVAIGAWMVSGILSVSHWENNNPKRK